uniref:Zinc finger protein 578-like n=1 Tax=Fundulus heteroclitus TaxID=8078 RepID=A0A3Q2TNP2_FUNHE
MPVVSQTANWLNESSASEDLGLHLSEPFPLKTLLLHHRELGTLSSGEIKDPSSFLHQKRLQLLKTHVKLHSFRYCCIDCEKGFTSQSGYYHHQRLHKKGRVFTCKECNKGFLCSYSLKQHERVHDGERNFLCTTCGKAFLSSGELRLHNRSHTEMFLNSLCFCRDLSDKHRIQSYFDCGG